MIWRLVLTTLGVLFWLLPLIGGAGRARTYGPDGDQLALVIIPAAMMILSVGLGAAPRRLVQPAMALGSVLAVCAAVGWMALWGASV